MAMQGSGGEAFSQSCHKGAQCGFLLRRTGVGGIAGCIEAADVANAYAAGVMPFAVGAGLRFRTPAVNAAVEVDDVVIAYAAESTLTMPAVDVGNGEVSALFGGGAMEDDFGDVTHD